MGSDGNRPQYVVRRDTPQPMWLSREQPTIWGKRDHAIRYRSKGEAARAIARLRLGAASIEPAPPDERPWDSSGS